MAKRPKKSKEDRLTENLEKVVRQLMQGRSYQPMSLEQLAEKLSLPPQHKNLLHTILKRLVRQNEAALEKGLYRWRESAKDIVSGVIRVHPRGFGFVEPDDPAGCSRDIFIPKQFVENAVDGDKVEVLINTASVSEKGPEGRVVAITERGRTHVAGTIYHCEEEEIYAHAPILGLDHTLFVQNGSDRELKEGDRIVMKVVKWGDDIMETVAEAVHIIGHISDPACDIPAAIEEYDLHGDFPAAVKKEVGRIPGEVTEKDNKGREDLRALEPFTIDPDSAKDFDDALSISFKKGRYRLGVHIADVSYYVRPGSALDKEALMRANSTYFPGYCLPMLPQQLSNGLCSLKPEVDRLAASVLMEFDETGELLDYRITRSVIKSVKRFTYSQAKEVLDGKARSPYAAPLKMMVKLALLLKGLRHERGSIDLALPELQVLVDEKGIPTGTRLIEYDITHQLVEEFMLKANEVVARHLDLQEQKLAFRIHEEPSAEQFSDFVKLARTFGFEVPDNPDAGELQQLFDEAVKTPYGQHLASSYIRRMKMAIYSPENIGHYGLSLTHYCHFTSPIRRYADLAVHRILFGESVGNEPLEQIASRCSEQERLSAKAENSVILLKKLRLLEKSRKQERFKEHPAVITAVKPFGITVEVLDYAIEAFIHISEIGDDYYVFDEGRGTLVGDNSGRRYKTGDDARVLLRHLDLITLETRWELIEEAPPKKPGRKKRRRRK